MPSLMMATIAARGVSRLPRPRAVSTMASRKVMPLVLIANRRPTLALVTSPKRRAPLESKRKLTTHSPVWELLPAWALVSTRESELRSSFVNMLGFTIGLGLLMNVSMRR